jgi:hypothetical protein
LTFTVSVIGPGVASISTFARLPSAMSTRRTYMSLGRPPPSPIIGNTTYVPGASASSANVPSAPVTVKKFEPIAPIGFEMITVSAMACHRA